MTSFHEEMIKFAEVLRAVRQAYKLRNYIEENQPAPSTATLDPQLVEKMSKKLNSNKQRSK